MMVCGHCGQVVPWNLYGRCSWECYDQPRADPAEHEAMIEAAPEAFAFFMGIGPGERIDQEDG